MRSEEVLSLLLVLFAVSGGVLAAVLFSWFESRRKPDPVSDFERMRGAMRQAIGRDEESRPKT